MKVELLVNEQDVELYSEYDYNLVKLIKSINGAKFSFDPKKWKFPIEQYDKLIEKLAQNYIEYEIIKERKYDTDSKQSKDIDFKIDENEIKVELLVNEHDVELYSEYDHRLVLLIKSIKGSKFSYDPKKWKIPIEHYEELVSKLKQHNIEIKLITEKSFESSDEKNKVVNIKINGYAIFRQDYFDKLNFAVK